ncbi:tryptophan-rich sensory protein [Candidatus Pacearchaeota archaeon]|nr:tryptophan-rich sensory protein [Candidatus Pacearchaeota archaeon]
MFTWLKNLLNREQTSKKEKLFSGLIAFAFIFFVGFRGNIMDEKGSVFYDSLIRPDITPPTWIFPFVWTTLFVLIGLAGYHVWNFYENDRMRKIFTGLYFVNGLLIYLWPYLFFTQQAIGGALYAIIGMIIVAELMILAAFKTNHKAAYLLIPYLLWILFATYLNISFLVLNA